MCGIVGSLRARAPITADDVAAVRRLLDAQAHRGPDGVHVESVGGAVLVECSVARRAWTALRTGRLRWSRPGALAVLGGNRLAGGRP
jgi:hypothetical protein